jgi:serine/threonine protein kinase
MSPEALDKGRFSTKSDVWAFGVLAFELLSNGRMPFANVLEADLHAHIVDGNQLTRPTECSSTPLWNVVEMCWERVPNKRPTFGKLGVLLEQLPTNLAPTPTDRAVVVDVHAELEAARQKKAEADREVRHLETMAAIAKIQDAIDHETESQQDVTKAVEVLKVQSRTHQQTRQPLLEEKARLELRIRDINTQVGDIDAALAQCEATQRNHELTLEEGDKRIATLQQQLARVKGGNDVTASTDDRLSVDAASATNDVDGFINNTPGV